jgi:hypothetical protein
MMVPPSAPKRFGLACVALLLGVAAACSGREDARSPSVGGATNAAGTAAESAGMPGDDTSPAAGVTGDAGAGGNLADGGASGAGGAPSELPEMPAYASSVESFTPGDSAGFNQAKLPDIVLGPPQGKGNGSGTLDVVSLGAGGEIVLGFGELGIVDAPGPDLLVFENAFWPNDDKAMVFAELGEVSVSEDGETWHSFPCDTVGDGQGNFPGCAGVTPTLEYDAATLVPLDPEKSGGDAFDLADVGLAHARFVKIRDLETQPVGGNTTGFDLDAVAAIHAQ